MNKKRVVGVLASPTHKWQTWVGEQFQGWRILNLDSSNTEFALPGCAELHLNEELQGFRFLGSTQPALHPLRTVQAALALLPAQGECVVILPPLKRQPVALQLHRVLLEALGIEEWFAAEDDGVPKEGWSIGPDWVADLPAQLPGPLLSGQRRGRWIGFQHECMLHEFSLGPARVEGTRLGIGDRKTAPAWLDAPVYIEVAGASGYVISENGLTSSTADKLCQHFHLNRLHEATAEDFEHVVTCAMRRDGTPMQMAIIERLELARERFILRSPMAEGSKPAYLDFGTMRVDGEGRELAELRPWSV